MVYSLFIAVIDGGASLLAAENGYLRIGSKP
jgi:hypothetical protein